VIRVLELLLVTEVGEEPGSTHTRIPEDEDESRPHELTSLEVKAINAS